MNGSITATNFEFSTKFKCDYDLTDFPSDEHYCCEEFTSKGKVILFYQQHEQINYDKIIKRGHWKIVNATTVYSLYDGNVKGYGIFYVCIGFRRSSASLYAEVVLPIAACIAMVIVLSFFTTWKRLIFGQCFCLLVQFLCLFGFNQMWHKPTSDEPPKIRKLQ